MNQVDISKFDADTQIRIKDVLTELQNCGDKDCVFIVGGGNKTDSQGEEGMSTTARFIGIHRPMDMILLMSSMNRTFATICERMGLGKEATKYLAHSAVEFGIDVISETTNTLQALDGEPSQDSKDMADAILAALMAAGKGDSKLH